MKICLIGYGKMGKAIEAIALQKGYEISYRITSENSTLLREALRHSDVAIEFTKPDLAVDHIKLCFESNKPIICGTTGWYGQLEDIKSACKLQSGSLVYASNFSIGVNIFFALNRYLANLMKSHPEYRISLKEAHHTEKLDAPSGTAFSLANDILKFNSNYTEWTKSSSIDPTQIAIESIREKNVVGTHWVNYKSSIDELEIKHEAFSREGFAAGSLLAASWILNNKGIYTMNDVLGL
ncbi:MAG: 4-hydroxy-tetrahydrodipicolinate reductase [Bacteroidota bacterium]|nr:4-hydroxy-tetrahydrodipicolinate reductase [Bacteroidota bacterium]